MKKLIPVGISLVLLSFSTVSFATLTVYNDSQTQTLVVEVGGAGICWYASILPGQSAYYTNPSDYCSKKRKVSVTYNYGSHCKNTVEVGKNDYVLRVNTEGNGASCSWN